MMVEAVTVSIVMHIHDLVGILLFMHDNKSNSMAGAIQVEADLQEAWGSFALLKTEMLLKREVLKVSSHVLQALIVSEILKFHFSYHET